MAGQRHDTTALLTEHFRYTPLTLLDEIINTVNELVYHAVNQLEKALTSASTELLGFEPDETSSHLDAASRQAALDVARQNEVDLGIVQIEGLLNATVDKDFDKFEIYTLRNILAIGHDEDGDLARWVCLDHYRHLKLVSTSPHLTPESVQLQRRKLHETTKLNAMLREEQARNATVLAQLENFLAGNASMSLGFLTSRVNGEPQAKEMQHAVEQLPQIRQALSQLKTALNTRPSRTPRPQQEAASLKRRTYLDSQAVKALNRQGIEVEAERASSIVAQYATRDNVQSLEAIVRGLYPARTMPPAG